MHRVVLAAAMLGGVVLRLIRFAENRPLWYDEALVAINVGSRDFLALLGPLDFEQMAPGLYLWFLKGLVMAFGMHEWVLRLPSLVAGAGLPLVVWLVGRRVLSERGALTAAVLAAIAPAFVGYSAEAKPYGIDACVTGILLLCALRLNERDDRGRRLAFGVVGLVAIGLSLPSVFVLAGLGVVLLASAWRRRNGSGTA
ncbi:MAG: glycosyltransferase family 39 protein, partial [Gemmatimonadales bacterium]